MNGADLKAWREASGLSQSEAATALGSSRPTIARAEASPLATLSEKVELALRRLTGEITDDAPAPTAKPAKAKAAPAIDPKRIPRAYDFAKAPAFTRDLERLPVTNAFPGGASPHWDERPASPGWQRIPGCIVICVDSIPGPIPFRPAQSFGPRAVLTASGQVFDGIAGHRIGAPGGERQPRSLEPFQREPKKAKR